MRTFVHLELLSDSETLQCTTGSGAVHAHQYPLPHGHLSDAEDTVHGHGCHVGKFPFSLT